MEVATPYFENQSTWQIIVRCLEEQAIKHSGQIKNIFIIFVE